MNTSSPTSAIKEERQRATFNVRELTHILNGGAEKTKLREEIRALIYTTDGSELPASYSHLDRAKQYHHGLDLANRVFDVMDKLGVEDDEDERYRIVLEEMNKPSPMGLHTSMFIPTLKGQATSEQQAHWMPLARSRKILGTYAQTELGHGTFVRGLETTSTYDPSTQEFVINCPTVTSTKFWPGGLGYTSTHAIVMARLITQGQDYGVHPFIVQLRSLQDHKPLPGIELGDIGPKFGFNTNDNGYLRLNNVRIPRSQMLMRFAKVTPEGYYEKPPHAKIAYGTMIFVRSMLISDASNALAKATTIAIRYSCIRQQGLLLSKTQEQKLLDYRTQQYRLMPLVAAAYAMQFAGQRTRALYKELTERIEKGDFSILAEAHATSAGLKGICTTLTADGIEECRKCCGGHGYSLLSGLPTLFADYVPACTYEGDNIVLLLQTARYLVKSIGAVSKRGKTLQGTAKYLENFQSVSTERCLAKKSEDFLNSDVQLAAYRHRAIRLVLEAGQLLQIDLKNGKPWQQAWNNHMVDLVRAAKAHCQFILLQIFVDAVSKLEKSSHGIQKVLKRLCDLFALYYMESTLTSGSSAEFTEDGYLSLEQVRMVRDQVQLLLDELRPDAVPLVDAFNIPDVSLESAIGRYDGNAYETLFKWSKSMPFNVENAKTGGVDLEAYNRYIKPTLLASVTKSKL